MRSDGFIYIWYILNCWLFSRFVHNVSQKILLGFRDKRYCFHRITFWHVRRIHKIESNNWYSRDMMLYRFNFAQLFRTEAYALFKVRYDDPIWFIPWKCYRDCFLPFGINQVHFICITKRTKKIWYIFLHCRYLRKFCSVKNKEHTNFQLDEYLFSEVCSYP